LGILEILHDAGYAYGNNFSLSNVVFEEYGERASLFSFERCLRFKDIDSDECIPQKRATHFSGDAKFASVT